MLRGKRKEGVLPDAFFQTVFQTSPDAALVTRVCDGSIIHVNDGFCKITGYTRQEVLGKTTLALNLFFEPEDRDKFLAAMSVTGSVEARPGVFRRRDGSRYCALLSARSFWSDGYEYVCASVRDITEEQRLAHENRERDAAYQRLFETMTQGIVYQDALGNILSANPAAERMLGLPLAELTKRTTSAEAWKVQHEDGTPLPEHENPVTIALRTGKPFGPITIGLYHEKRQDTAWLKVVATPLFREKEKQPYQVYIVMDDITTQKKAQESYQLLFDEMMDAFTLNEIILDEHGNPVNYRYLAVNPAFERMVGLPSSALVGKTILELLPQTEQMWIDAYGKVALTGEPITFQFFTPEMDQYFNVSAYRPAPMQFACLITDVTSRVRFQQEKDRAQEQINRLAHICDVAPSSILVFDNTGSILYANEYTAKMHGYTKSELMTMHVYDLSHDTNSEMILESIRQIRQEGELVMRRTVQKRDDSPIPLLIYAKTVEWDGHPRF